MRGQRPALSSLLAWIAVLALLMGSLAVLAPTMGPGTATALPQLPLEERGGGEDSLHEEAPAKLRRATVQAQRTDDAAPPLAVMRPAITVWKLIIRPQQEPARLTGCWSDASPRPPRDDAPGRRQQRGQAPPLA